MNTINIKLYDAKGTSKDTATKEDIYKLDLKIEQTKNDGIKWMFGFLGNLVLLILANWFLKK